MIVVGHLLQRGDGRTQTARAEASESGLVSGVLRDAGLAVAAVVVRVDAVAGLSEGLCDVVVAQGVVAEPVGQLHNGLRLGRLPHVVVNGHAVGVDVRVVGSLNGGSLRHGASSLSPIVRGRNSLRALVSMANLLG